MTVLLPRELRSRLLPEGQLKRVRGLSRYFSRPLSYFLHLPARAQVRRGHKWQHRRDVKRQLSAAADKRLAMGKGDAANQGIGATRLRTG
jgi:hypothetical protein